ncbi:PREDICTED: death domain-containing protein 1 [Gavialis gangeticus]|uniref:death domain-containing protein 1 n=1 Tax=Gavialis gangeticus TaxID=94835 RepID=UPI00092FC3B8|nr:PREDICTED: death domain-containing protein 1 [Gavialis gangeticus]
MEASECKLIPAAYKSSQLLEEIWHLNLTLKETLLKKDFQKNEDTVEYVRRLFSLAKELSRSLSQQLEHTTETLKDTCQILNILHDKHKQVSSQERITLVDYLWKMKDLFLDTFTYFQEMEKKLYDISCRDDDKSQSPTVQNISKEIDGCNFEREKTQYEKESSVCQSGQITADEERKHQNTDQVQLSENEAVKIETVLSSEKISAQEETLNIKPPKLNENAEHEVIKNSLTEQDYNGKEKANGVRSFSKRCPDGGFQEAPGNSGEDNTIPQKFEGIFHGHSMIYPKQEQVVSKESSKQMEGKDQNPTENSSENQKYNKKKKIHEIVESYQVHTNECARSENTCDTPSVIPSTSDSAEEQQLSQPINKQFLVEVSGNNEQQVACYITAPSIILENLVCRIINDMSSLVVDDSEELVSNIIGVECLDNEKRIPFPIIIAIPFTTRLRSNYREILVKVTDKNFQSSYLPPISLEGYQGNHKGNFAEVNIYQLGIFSVLSCLKTEIFTVPKEGVSQKLSMDSRVSLYYPPEMFSSPASMQLKVQPIEPSLVSILKTKYDMYHSVVSTSPLVHIQHPSFQPFNKSVTIILPCPPNPEKKRQGDEIDRGRATSSTVTRTATAYRFRAMSASGRNHREKLTESLKLLGYKSKEEEWVVLDDVIVQNARNGLVSFELDEHLESFIVIRLSFLVDNKHLVLFIKALDEAIHSTMANIVLYRKKENPYRIVVLLVPSKELNWELQRLREEGYFGPPEPTHQFQLREGDQIHFRFTGNIFASDNGKDFGKAYKLIFHAQRKPRLELQIKEVDEFGNHSSPHYKGTAVFYKKAREKIAKNWEKPLFHDDDLQQPQLCKLALTLPKQEKLIKHPQSTKRISTNSSEALWDNLFYWLAEELSEDNASLLALHLPIRRSTLQLIRVKCPDDFTNQIYELLCSWKRNLPRSADKQRLLSRYLRKSGRIDLSEELRFKCKNKVFTQQKHWFEINN